MAKPTKSLLQKLDVTDARNDHHTENCLKTFIRRSFQSQNEKIGIIKDISPVRRPFYIVYSR